MLLAHTFEENFNFSAVNSTEAFEKERFIENKDLSLKSPNEINSSRCLVDKTAVSVIDNKREVIKLSRERACVRIQTCISYLYKYFEITLDCLLLRVVLHILEDARSYFCSLSESDQIYFIKDCFHVFIEVDEKVLERYSDELQNFPLSKEEKDLAFMAYLLIYAKKMHFLKIFESFEEYGAPVPEPFLSVSEKFSYFRNRRQYFCIGNDGYVVLSDISHLEILNSHKFSSCINMPTVAYKDIAKLSSGNNPEMFNAQCCVETKNLTSNKINVKISGEHARARIQKCIAYLCNYFELTLDCDLLRAVLYILNDSRSYFCSLSQDNQIYFIKECFCPFLEVSDKMSEYYSIKFQDCKLGKEEKDLVFIAYILIYAKEMHFLKIFECFEEYGAPTPNPHLSTSKKFTYFRNRKPYFYIGNDGYVSLNSLSELVILNNPNISYWVNTECTSISKIPELSSVHYSGMSKQICSVRTNKLLFKNHNEVGNSDCLLDKTDVSLINNNAGTGNLSREHACGRIHACIAHLYKYFEIALDSLLLRVVLHILEDCKLYFCNLPEFDQICFVEDCFHNFIRNEKKVLEYFSVKGQDCRLSKEEKDLVFIAYILVYAKEMHFLKIFGCFEEYGAAPPNPHLSESEKFTYFRNRKKYFHIGDHGYVILNDVSELNVLNSINISNFFGTLCKRNPPVSPVDSGTCLSPVSCEQEEKNIFSTNIALSIAENITDLCVKILSNSNQMHFEKICKILTCYGSEEIQSFIQSLSISEKLDFFKNASDKFEIRENAFVMLKTSVEQLNAPTCTENHEKYVSIDLKTQEAAEREIIVLPSCSQVRISSPLTKDEGNGENNDDVATPLILCEPLRSCVSSKESCDQGKGINSVSYTNSSISKNCVFKKEKLRIFDSSNHNNHSVRDKHVLPNLQDSSGVTKRGEMPTNFLSCPTDKVKQNECSEIIDISKDVSWNGKSLEDEYANVSTADENPSDSIAVKKSVKIESFSTIRKDKITLHDKVDEKPVSVRNTDVLKPCKTLYTWSAEHCDLKENITSSNPVPSSSSNCKSEQENVKSLKTVPSNEVKNGLYPCDISSSATQKLQDALSNISPSIKPDFLSESNQTFSNVSVPAVEKRISYLQKLPEQSPAFLKYPKSVSKLSISRHRKAAMDLKPSTVSCQYSNCLTDDNFEIIKPQSFSFDDKSYNEYCSEVLDSFLGPLNLETGNSVTSNTLEREELVNHDVLLCVKEVEELDNFTLNISEENIFAKSFFPASNVHKHAQKELQAINFFTVILGKYSSGLSLQMLYIHLKTASREVIEYLNNCYEHNLLHFFCANKRHFYVSPISHNVYLRNYVFAYQEEWQIQELPQAANSLTMPLSPSVMFHLFSDLI